MPGGCYSSHHLVDMDQGWMLKANRERGPLGRVER